MKKTIFSIFAVLVMALGFSMSAGATEKATFQVMTEQVAQGPAVMTRSIDNKNVMTESICLSQGSGVQQVTTCQSQRTKLSALKAKEMVASMQGNASHYFAQMSYSKGSSIDKEGSGYAMSNVMFENSAPQAAAAHAITSDGKHSKKSTLKAPALK